MIWREASNWSLLLQLLKVVRYVIYEDDKVLCLYKCCNEGSKWRQHTAITKLQRFMCKNYANAKRYSSLLVHRNIEIISFVVYLNIKKCNRLKFLALD